MNTRNPIDRNRRFSDLLLIGTAALVALLGAARPTSAQSDVIPAETFHVEFGTAWWQPNPELSINTDALGSVGVTDFDFVEEFGISSSWFSEFRGVIKPARTHKFRISYVPIRYEKTAQLRRAISFNGDTFTGPATGAVAWNLWRFGYEWDFVSRPRGFVGLLADVKVNTVRGAVRSSGVAAAVEAQPPVPGIGFIGRGYVHPKVAISAEFTGFKFAGGDIDGSLFDFDVMATGNIFKSFGVEGGYRAVTADYNIDSDRGELKLRGPYVGIVSRF